MVQYLQNILAVDCDISTNIPFFDPIHAIRMKKIANVSSDAESR